MNCRDDGTTTPVRVFPEDQGFVLPFTEHWA